MSKKIIVTNRSQLLRKYTAKGLKAFEADLKKLAAADKKHRGLDVSIVYLDDAASMKPYGSPVKQATDPKQNKAAIDAVFIKETPDYLTILGAPDVVPHQDLKNPVYDPRSDGDAIAWSDLPYACNQAYSREIQKFLGPTRVVGRLPDLACAANGDGNLKYLQTVIRAAAAAKPKPTPTDYFGLSAAVWTKSTELSLSGLFGNAAALFNSPPHGFQYTAAQLGKLAHFVNCHGAEVSPQFFGQDPQNLNSYPPSLDSSHLAGVVPGTVAAFECCYGGELYDPAAAQNVMGISNRYLLEKAAGVCASTTIAYGPADSNAQADLLCRYFLAKTLGGASIGRAMLEARLDYIRAVGTLSPVDLKTIAQFLLLGDPSVQPFDSGSKGPVEAVLSGKSIRMVRSSAGDSDNGARTARRAKLAQFGAAVGATASYADDEIKRPTLAVCKFLAAQLQVPVKQAKLMAFNVRRPAMSFISKSAAKLTSAGADKHYVMIHPVARDGAPFQNLVGCVASEIDGRIIVRKFERR